MNISETAEKRLKALLPPEAVGYSATDFVGTCRGSTPVIQPVQAAQPDQETLTQNGLTFFVNRKIVEKFSTCDLDYDRSFLGKGLNASWPQCNECNCHS